jgi:hypothetical protein
MISGQTRENRCPNGQIVTHYDPRRTHFLFGPDQPFRIEKLASDLGTRAGLFIAQPFAEEKLHWTNAIIINEYGALWLNRDGTPTLCSRPVYDYLLGTNSTTAQRRYAYARNLAALTEFFRSHRQAAGVLYFCGLGYSRPDGWTSDNWTDVEKLTWDPEFYTYVRDAFAPVGLAVNFWKDQVIHQTQSRVPVILINDLAKPWSGPVTLKLRQANSATAILEVKQDARLEPFGQAVLNFEVSWPESLGQYTLDAELRGADGLPVHSLREMEIIDPPVPGPAYQKPATKVHRLASVISLMKRVNSYDSFSRCFEQT